jgi:large subunit ribosomal protein L17
MEKLITKGKKGDAASRRIVISKLSNRSKEVNKLFEFIAPKYVDKNGGYTRVLKLGARKSDGAAMAVIEFI